MPKWTRAGALTAIPILALAAVFGFAAYERFGSPLVPTADRDVWAYLTPGLGKLLGERFAHVNGQCFLYPWILYVILDLGGDFHWVTIVQHLLGLCTGALLMGCWMQLRLLPRSPRVPALAFKLSGALLVCVYLLSTATIKFERLLRPEAFFEFCVALNIYCNLQFIRDRFLAPRPRVALLSGGAAVFLSVAAFLLKPSFSAVLFLANLPVMLSLFYPGQSIRQKTILLGVPIFAAVLLLLGPEWKLRQEDPLGALYLARSLFSIHADIIDDQLAEDVAQKNSTPFPPEFIAAAHDALTKALGESRRKENNSDAWPVLGFNADYIVNGKRLSAARLARRSETGEKRPSIITWISEQLGSTEKTVEFCQYYYWRAVRHRPLMMSAKIFSQLGAFYRFGDCPAYLSLDSIDAGKEYQKSAAVLAASSKLPLYPPGAVFLAETETLKSSGARIETYWWMAFTSRLLAASYLVWCLWAVMLALCTWKNPKLRNAFFVAAPVLLLLYCYNFGTVLTLAIGHSLDITRYNQYQLAYTLLAESCSIWLAIEFFLLLAGRSPGKEEAMSIRSDSGPDLWPRGRRSRVPTRSPEGTAATSAT